MTPRAEQEDLLREALVSEGCPDPADWHRLASGVGDETTAARLLEHAGTCTACAEEARLAALFEEPVAGDDAEVRALVGELRARRSPQVRRIDERRIGQRKVASSAPRRVTGSHSWRYALAAAVVAVVVGAGMFLSRQGGPPPVGAPGDGSVLRGGTVELLAPLGEIDAAPSVLSWEAASEATAYRVSLSRVDGRIIWGAETTSTEVEVPAEVLATLHPAVTYRLRVTALSASGTEIGHSLEGEFQIRPEPDGV